MSIDSTPPTLPAGIDDGSPMVVLAPDGWFHLYNWKTDSGCPIAAFGKEVSCVKRGHTFLTAVTSHANLIKNWHRIEKFKVVGDATEHANDTPKAKPENAKKYNHYFVPVPYSHIDVYRVLELFKVTDNAIGHAVKKLLVPGLRGNKPTKQDIIEARDTLNRRIEMWDEDKSFNDDML